MHSLARGELFSDYMRKSVCVSFPHQRLGWKQFWVLPGMQELVLKWLTKLLSCKRSTKHYLGIRGGEGKIKGDVEFWVEYLIHLFQIMLQGFCGPSLRKLEQIKVSLSQVLYTGHWQGKIKTTNISGTYLWPPYLYLTPQIHFECILFSTHQQLHWSKILSFVIGLCVHLLDLNASVL